MCASCFGRADDFLDLSLTFPIRSSKHEAKGRPVRSGGTCEGLHPW